MTFRASSRRKKPRWLLLIVSVAMLSLGVGAIAQAVVPGGTTFEGNDGNLAPSSASFTDWNTFSSSPGVKSAAGLAAKFTVATDDTGNSDATIFTKSTKSHAVECPNVGSGSMGGGGNKDDLARMYLATETIGTNVFLYLAWVRVYPQNSTTAAANLSFEFNASSTTCAGAGFTGSRASNLKPRTAGDMLVLYDFDGGTTEQGSGNPQIRISRWITSGACEVGNQTAPCWGPVQTLTASQAEARVNDASIGAVSDQWSGDQIGTVAFGEAAINLTAAGVFGGGGTPTQCVSFGSALGISRSSGNSITSSLSDYVGPVGFTLSNCGSVIIRKATSPAGDTTTGFDFTASSLTRLLPGSTSTTIPTRTGEGVVLNWANVAPGTNLRITETDPGPLYALTSITCTSGSTATAVDRNATSGTVNGVPARTVEFDLAAGQTLDCTFTNTRQQLAPAMNTSPWIYPNDKATVSANAAFSDVDGSVTFKLYGGADAAAALTNCQANGATGLLYSQIVDLPDAAATSKDANTTNGSGSPTPVKVEASATVYWRVQYSGDSNHLGRVSNCTENIAVTLTGDSSGGSTP